MDIFPDYLGETGGAGTPYPVVIGELALEAPGDGLALEVTGSELTLEITCAEFSESLSSPEQNWDEIEENWDEIDWNWDGN